MYADHPNCRLVCGLILNILRSRGWLGVLGRGGNNGGGGGIGGRRLLKMRMRGGGGRGVVNY